MSTLNASGYFRTEFVERLLDTNKFKVKDVFWTNQVWMEQSMAGRWRVGRGLHVCVRACMRACVCVCAHVRVCVCYLNM